MPADQAAASIPGLVQSMLSLAATQQLEPPARQWAHGVAPQRNKVCATALLW